MVYKKIECGFCKSIFQPTTSRNKHCSPECRFKDIASAFTNPDQCWEWPLSLNKNTGYGQFNISSNPITIETAHRMSYRVFIGDIEDGKYICHKCDNRSCFNPDHLFIGTPLDNNRDMLSKGRDGLSKITVETAALIKEKLKTLSPSKVSREMGISKDIVNNIHRGKTWLWR